MSQNLVRRAAVLAPMLTLTILVGMSRGQITGVINSDVQGFFGSTNDVYQQTESPNNGANAPWTNVSSTNAPTLTPPPPYAPSGLPNIPPLYAGFPNVQYPLTQNIGFAAPLGHAPSSPFTDGFTFPTSADYHIYGGYAGPATDTRDAGVVLGNNSGTLMYLDQNASATGYAYEEVEFAIDYAVGPAGLIAGAPGLRPYLVEGSFLPGGFAEFGAQVNYTFLPVSPVPGIYGPPVALGSLGYEYFNNSVGGPFLQTVDDNFFGSTNLLGASGAGVLELTGDIYLIGDPVDISVEAVPEPSSAVLLLMGVVGLGLLALRRWRSRAAGLAAF